MNRDLLQDLSDVDSDSKLIPLGVYSDSETEEFVYIPKRWQGMKEDLEDIDDISEHSSDDIDDDENESPLQK